MKIIEGMVITLTVVALYMKIQPRNPVGLDFKRNLRKHQQEKSKRH